MVNPSSFRIFTNQMGVIITSMSKVPTKAVINTADWDKCVYCKDSIPPGLKLTKICLTCLTNKK